MELKINNGQELVNNWLTADKLEELCPAIEASAQEKTDRMIASWTPEFRAALRKLREQRSSPLP